MHIHFDVLCVIDLTSICSLILLAKLLCNNFIPKQSTNACTLKQTLTVMFTSLACAFDSKQIKIVQCTISIGAIYVRCARVCVCVCSIHAHCLLFPFIIILLTQQNTPFSFLFHNFKYRKHCTKTNDDESNKINRECLDEKCVRTLTKDII